MQAPPNPAHKHAWGMPGANSSQGKMSGRSFGVQSLRELGHAVAADTWRLSRGPDRRCCCRSCRWMP